MFQLLVKNLFQKIGIELRRLRKIDPLKQKIPVEMRQLYWLKQLQIETVIDIGANIGQFANGIRKLLPNAKILSFEPLPSCYQQLVTSTQEDPNLKAFNLALGDETGKIKIYQNEFSPSSSLLPLAELHKTTFPFAQDVLELDVEIVRLDDISLTLELSEPILIKLDVQGFEDRVIEGGISVFSRASIIIIELSIVPLYEGQHLFDKIYQKLISLGFLYYGNLDQAADGDGNILYVDSIFVKDKITKRSE